MSNSNPSEASDFDAWKDLQVALGLTPGEGAPPVKPAERLPAPPPMSRMKPPVQPLFDAPSEPFGAGLEQVAFPGEGAVTADPALGDDSSMDQDVEMGEAPEEVPEEPGAPEEKKRRRRRRRRRRGPGEGEAEGAPAGDGAASGAGGPAVSLGAGAPDQPGDLDSQAAEDDLEAGDDLGDDEDDEDGEVEPLAFTDWSVPSWQELISGLYRPER